MKLNQNEMSYNDLEEFDNDVLSLENPTLQKYLMNGDKLRLDHDKKWMRLLIEYVNSRKQS